VKLVFLPANQRWFVVYGEEIVNCHGCPRSWEKRKDAVSDLKKLNLDVDRKNNVMAIGEVFGVSSVGIGGAY